MEDDWDLYAVVRGCNAPTTAVTSSGPTAGNTTPGGQLLNSSKHHDCIFPAPASYSCFRDLFSPPWKEGSAADQELHELYKPFIPNPSDYSQFAIPPQSLPTNSLLGGLLDLADERQPVAKQATQPVQFRQKQQSFCFGNGSKPTAVSHNPSHRSKKRKNLMKRVCHVAAENLSSDFWSWRKYGQKPIKGSPYPRGYYRCSTSKGCVARKQVERNRSDPGMFIVTYTAEHNHPMPTHRNSLAGSTRQKPTDTPNSDDSAKAPASTGTSPTASNSSAPGKAESSREDDEDGFSISKMDLEDDFFAGLEDFTADECTSGHFPAGVELPWRASSATTIAGGG